MIFILSVSSIVLRLSSQRPSGSLKRLPGTNHLEVMLDAVPGLGDALCGLRNV